VNVIKNLVKEKIRQGKLALGTYVYLEDPAVIEIVGMAGFDSAFIDMEHSAFDLPLVERMVRACDLAGICSLVRVPDNNPKTILRVLETGAQGIQVPHIAGREDAMEAVKAVRYAPLGDRGMGGPTRAARYGSVPTPEHIASSNREVLLAVMVEDMEAVHHLEEIASIDGLDLIAIGPSDLSQSLGVSEPGHPKLKKTIEEISLTLKRVGKAKMTLPLGNYNLPITIAELKRLGVAYSNCNPADVSRLLNSYREQMKELQSQL
jgi:4-hydroxy-2-oxoheptanedioate aldolase